MPITANSACAQRADERVVLVDECDVSIGSAEKHYAHRQGLLHRAFSIFLFDDSGRTLLQQRAFAKYHSGGKWANTCCGHPRPGETISIAARRRLNEELGLDTHLLPTFHARYRVDLDGGMVENEYVYVFIGRLNGTGMQLNAHEVQSVKAMSLDEIRRDVGMHPDHYAYWFRFYCDRYNDDLASAAETMRLKFHSGVEAGGLVRSSSPARPSP